jgi:Ser/Thr protein kinase RdoA (MazF antagonist)
MFKKMNTHIDGAWKKIKDWFLMNDQREKRRQKIKQKRREAQVRKMKKTGQKVVIYDDMSSDNSRFDDQRKVLGLFREGQFI